MAVRVGGAQGGGEEPFGVGAEGGVERDGGWGWRGVVLHLVVGMRCRFGGGGVLFERWRSGGLHSSGRVGAGSSYRKRNVATASLGVESMVPARR